MRLEDLVSELEPLLSPYSKCKALTSAYWSQRASFLMGPGDRAGWEPGSETDAIAGALLHCSRASQWELEACHHQLEVLDPFFLGLDLGHSLQMR